MFTVDDEVAGGGAGASLLGSSSSCVTGTRATGTRTAAWQAAPLSTTTAPGAAFTVTRNGRDESFEEGTSVLMLDETPPKFQGSAIASKKLNLFKKRNEWARARHHAAGWAVAGCGRR